MSTGRLDDSTLFIAISTEITDPTLKTNAPSGDVAYFLVSKLNFKTIVGNKITILSGRYTFSDKRGMVSSSITIREGWLLNKDINELVEKIINGGHVQSHGLLYMFVKLNEPGGGVGGYDSDANYLSFMDKDENTVWHLKGHLKTSDIDIEGTNLYKLKLQFIEITSGT